MPEEFTTHPDAAARIAAAVESGAAREGQTDEWLAQSVIARDPYMAERIAACAAKNGCAENAGLDPDQWALQWRRVWASAPGWWQAWQSALAGGIPEPGREPSVITDAMIDSHVQQMMPFTRVEDHAPLLAPRD